MNKKIFLQNNEEGQQKMSCSIDLLIHSPFFVGPVHFFGKNISFYSVLHESALIIYLQSKWKILTLNTMVCEVVEIFGRAFSDSL